jgi:hypothetical protein
MNKLTNCITYRLSTLETYIIGFPFGVAFCGKVSHKNISWHTNVILGLG